MNNIQLNSLLPSRKTMSSVWILLCCVFCLGILLRLVHQSMYLDGGIYATMSLNLAQGQGTPWALHFSDTLFPVFVEHPPLMLWLQAVCFSILGDSIAVEKGFSLLTFFACAGLLFKIWMRLNKDDSLMQQAFPFALFLMLIAGQMSWGYANGLLENLLSIFSLWSILLIIIAYDRPTPIHCAQRIGLMAATGLFICLSIFTKGPVGLFPLVAPAIYWLIFRRPNLTSVVIDIFIILVILAIFLALLYSFTASREALERYLAVQLIPSLRGDRGTLGGGFNVLRKIIAINGYSIIITALAAFFGRRFVLSKENQDLGRVRRKWALFFLTIGISASLPIGLSPRVAYYYFNPSLLFYSLGFCLLAGPAIMTGLSQMGERASRYLWFASVLALLISITVVIANFGRPGEDEQTIKQAASINKFVCSGHADCKPIISACGDTVRNDQALLTYLLRRYKISLSHIDKVESAFLIADESCRHISGYSDTTLDISPYFLLQRQ